MAFHDTPLADLHLDPGLLNGVGIFDRDGGMFERKLPDLLSGLFGLIEPLGSAPDFVFGKGHWGSGCVQKKHGCKSA